jgi:hypothetical protein
MRVPHPGRVAECMGVVAGPSVICRISDHAGPDRIKFDITLTGQKVRTALYQTRLETALEQGAGAAIGEIEIAHIQAAEELHASGQRISRIRRHQQVCVVGHEYPGMYGHTEFPGALPEPVGVGLEVCIGGKANLAVIASLYNMNWDTGRALAMSARHRMLHDESVVRMPRTSTSRCLKSPVIRVSFYSDPNYPIIPCRVVLIRSQLIQVINIAVVKIQAE